MCQPARAIGLSQDHAQSLWVELPAPSSAQGIGQSQDHAQLQWVELAAGGNGQELASKLIEIQKRYLGNPLQQSRRLGLQKE